MRLGIGLVSCLAFFPAAEHARAWVLDEQTAVNFAGTKTYADATKLVELPLFDISPSIPLGAVGCVGACIGLTAQASGHADIDARFVVGYESFIDLAAKANARTFIFGQGQAPFVGDPFFLVTPDGEPLRLG